MIHPYRDALEVKQVKKLPRVRARLRGLYRRVILPAKIFGVSAAVFTAINLEACNESTLRQLNQDAVNRRHFEDWQQTIDSNQHKSDIRQAELERREHELDARIKTFEDIVSLAPALSKGSPQDGNAILGVLKGVHKK
jgi:hypothetical protein